MGAPTFGTFGAVTASIGAVVACSNWRGGGPPERSGCALPSSTGTPAPDRSTIASVRFIAGKEEGIAR